MDGLSRTTGIDHASISASEPFSTAASMSTLIEQLTGFIRRQYQIFIVVPIAAVALGLIYLAVTPPLYTAATTVLIDGSALRALQNQLQPSGDAPLDTVQVGSQVEILASDKIALAVIRELGLAEDPEFAGGIRIPLWPWSVGAGSKADKEQRALDEFDIHRSISRVERTYALNISYTSRSPDTAAKIANAIADAYLNDQLEAKYQTTRRASAWLQNRINELKAQVMAADQAVLEFKKNNNIVDFGGTNGTAGAGPSSRLIGEQQLFDLNSQLSAARVATNEARARLERIEQVRKLDVGEAAVSDSLRNEVITRLRNQYLDLSAREANWSSRYGRDHQAASNLRDQMEELRRNISAELTRVAASYQSDFEIAKTREETLDRDLASLIAEGQATNRDRIGLTELESAARSYHAIYDNFLQRYMEAIQQQSFPITDARVIDLATPPGRKSKPVDSLVLAIAATLGIILSLGMAALREATDGVFRTGRQIEQTLRIKCLSVIPLLTRQAVSAPPAARKPNPYAGAWRGSNQLASASDAPDQTNFTFTDPHMRRVVDEPLSQFAEAFRTIKVAAEIRAAARDNKVIGITSTLPNEGKSTVAANLAVLMTDAGRRVILIDADLRNPTLVGALAPRPTVGLMELLTGKIDLQQAIGRETDTGLTLLPLVLDEELAHSDEVLSSPAFRNLIDQLRQRYDFIIMDLPPIAPVIDVLAAAPVIDSLVFVVEWASTKIHAVQHHLTAEPELHDRLLGVVLNKVDLRVLERFDQRGLYQNGYYTNQAYRQSARSR